MTANDARQIGRAKNAILSFLERKLSVPKIYLDANWDGAPVDVLAIDRDGVGDVTVVLLYLRFSNDDRDAEMKRLESMIDRLTRIAGQFKYVAVVEAGGDTTGQPFKFPETLIESSFAPDGLGRIGFIRVMPGNDEPRVEVVFRAERFRAFIAQLADEYVQHHAPDWEMRA